VSGGAVVDLAAERAARRPGVPRQRPAPDADPARSRLANTFATPDLEVQSPAGDVDQDVVEAMARLGAAGRLAAQVGEILAGGGTPGGQLARIRQAYASYAAAAHGGQR
jgi:hypothetical protein